MLRILMLITMSFLINGCSMANSAGDFFPPEYKTFPFKEGDLLTHQDQDGHYSITKILKVDRIELKKGDTIGIQDQVFTATEDDFILIISSSYGKPEFSTLEDAKAAAKLGKWQVEYGHIPNRPPGAANGQVLIGHQPVQKDELAGYYIWREAFDKKEAGVF